jgi:hypothetical protein
LTKVGRLVSLKFQSKERAVNSFSLSPTVAPETRSGKSSTMDDNYIISYCLHYITAPHGFACVHLRARVLPFRGGNVMSICLTVFAYSLRMCALNSSKCCSIHSLCFIRTSTIYKIAARLVCVSSSIFLICSLSL